MKNAFRVLKRDIVRLLKTPAALIVVMALLFLPSIYTWYNVLGFWDPYNNTGNLLVEVVNEDEGATSDLTGEINIGGQIEDELKKNHQLDWQFNSYDTAIYDVLSGKAYAAFVIPKDFSANLLTLTSGDFKRPEIYYYVNEKLGPVAPKITDTGATTLDETINSSFIETVSDVAVKSINAQIETSKESIQASKGEAASNIDSVIADLESSSLQIENMDSMISGLRSSINTSIKDINASQESIQNAKSALSDLRSAASKAQKGLSDYTEAASNAIEVINDKIFDLIKGLEDPDFALNADKLNELIEKVKALSQALYGDTMPYVSNAVADVEAGASMLVGAVNTGEVLSDELKGTLNGMNSVLATAQKSLSDTKQSLDRSIEVAKGVRDDIDLITGSSLFNIPSSDGESDTLNASRIAEFMASPTRLTTEQLYPLNAYGSAMAPLFMNLTFWIGAFMLLVIMKQEVDSTGIKRLTLTQRYMGRFMLFSILAALQAIICVTGVLILGVEAVNPWALYLSSIMASLAYLSIIYMLSVTLQHIGKGICILMLFAQIPGATGLYPIEMTPPFFQAIYPSFPFTYGISAARESICGFYDFHFATDMIVLFAFFIAFIILGLILRPLMGNVNRMVANQIRRSGIYSGENVDLPKRTFRFSQIVRVLLDKEDFRIRLENRYEKFQRLEPKIMRALIIVGIIVPVISCFVFAFTPTEKIVILNIWLIWMIVIFIAMTMIETLKYSLEHQLKLGEMSNSDIESIVIDSVSSTNDQNLTNRTQKEIESSKDNAYSFEGDRNA